MSAAATQHSGRSLLGKVIVGVSLSMLVIQVALLALLSALAWKTNIKYTSRDRSKNNRMLMFYTCFERSTESNIFQRRERERTTSSCSP